MDIESLKAKRPRVETNNFDKARNDGYDQAVEDLYQQGYLSFTPDKSKDRYQEAFVRLRCMEIIVKGRSLNPHADYPNDLDAAAELLFNWAMQENTDA